MHQADNVQPMIAPDADQMLRHLEHLFGGDLDGCHEGRIELAWTDGKDGRLRHAAIFGTDQLNEVVERAVAVNSVPGQNVYVGQALRKPDIPPFGRCGDDDFLALSAFYADIDDDVADAARAEYRRRDCPPTAVVVTGRHPHVRVQMLWRQETPARDPDVCRRQNKALAEALGGDPSVVNPSRVLRLGGSVAWPVKPGRILERTEFHTFDDGRPRIYLPGQIAKAFPSALPALAPQLPSPSSSSTIGSPATTVQVPPASATVAPAPASLNIGSEFDGVTVESCLAAVRAGNHWHDNLVRLTGHWIARGWSDEEILTAGASLTLPGWTADQTASEVATMIAGGRAKWNVPNPAHEVTQPGTLLLPLAPAFIDDLNIAMLPRRPWVFGRVLLEKAVTVLVAPAGVGKSTLSIEVGVAVVTGREITGHAVHRQGKVWIYNNEDDADELKRRLGAVLQYWNIPVSEIRGRLALNSGADRPLLVASSDRAGNVIRRPDVDACIAHIREQDIGLFVVDPFVETHTVVENSNEQIKEVGAMFREIARQGNCAVLLVHHTSKPPQGSSDGHAGNMNTARGASSLPGIARVLQTLFSMSEKDAEKLNVPAKRRHLYVRLDDAKANFSLISPDALWFRREGVVIGNGDEVGVLVPEDLAPAEEPVGDDIADLHRTIIACLLARVSGPEVTLNAAAKLLAWGGDERFAGYRQTDTKGNQRARRSLRDAIMAACRSAIVVVSGGKTHGFTCDEIASPIVLKRFEREFSDIELAAQEPEFGEVLE